MRTRGVVLDDDDSGCLGLRDITIPLVEDTYRHEWLKRRQFLSVGFERGSHQRNDAKNCLDRAMISVARRKDRKSQRVPASRHRAGAPCSSDQTDRGLEDGRVVGQACGGRGGPSIAQCPSAIQCRRKRPARSALTPAQRPDGKSARRFKGDGGLPSEMDRENGCHASSANAPPQLSPSPHELALFLQAPGV